MSIGSPIPPNWEMIGQIAGTFLTGLAGVIYIYKKHIKTPLANLRNLSNVPHEVQKISQQLERNGGSTVADKIARIEENLERMEARQRHHLYHRGIQGIGLFETDAAGKWTIINPVVIEIFGRQEYELVGQGWINGLDRKHREVIFQSYLDAITNERIFETCVSIVNPMVGGTQQVEMKIMPLKLNSKIFAWCGELRVSEDL